MPYGPGIYDDLCTYVRQQSQGTLTIVLVVDGARGSGFSVQGPPRLHDSVPEMLEDMARAIRAMQQDQQQGSGLLN